MGSVCQSKSGLALQEIPEKYRTSSYHRFHPSSFSVYCVIHTLNFFVVVT